jgi:hypothetical protein
MDYESFGQFFVLFENSRTDCRIQFCKGFMGDIEIPAQNIGMNIM